MNTSQVPKECLAYEYKCYEGRCIPQDWLCDGTEDCEQGDDEAPTCRNLLLLCVLQTVAGI